MSDSLTAKPEHLIGISTGFDMKAFKAMYDGLCKVSAAPDVCVCGSRDLAEDAYSASEILGLKLAIVVDEELSPKRIWLTSAQALSDFPGGGLN